jgi:ATP-binding cassette, subfamily F, member 3
VIQLQQIEKQYGQRTLLDQVDWHIKANQRAGLVGPNGAGKTTLLKIIMGHIPSDGGNVVVGKGRTIGYLPQEVAELKGITVREEASKGLETVLAVGERLREAELALSEAQGDALEVLMDRYGALQADFERLGGFTAENRVEEVLFGLGFKGGEIDRDCAELSGGWQMRVVLARLLLQQPDVLLLDEPTNHLDLESVAWLENFLQAFSGSLVFISHDRWLLNRLCTHIAELAAGKVRVYTGNFESYLTQAEQEQALAERSAQNQQRRVAELERFITRFRAKASKARQVQSRVKALGKMDQVELRRAERTIHFELPDPPKSGRVVMTLTDVHKAYGDNIVYKGLQSELVRGRHIALVGPNGAGKSTLLKLFAGVTEYQRGQREVGYGAKLYYFAQHQVDVLDVRRTVFAEAAEDAGGHTPTRIRGVLGAFLFTGDAGDKRVGVLSGGEKNRLALVKMLLQPVNVLLLDEPTNHLDMASRAVLEEALRAYAGTVVLISHDRHFIDAVVDEVWEVQDGRITPFPCGYTEYLKRVARGDRPEPLPLFRPERAPRKPSLKAKPKAAPKPPEPTAEPVKIDWGGGGAVRRRQSREEKRAAAENRQRVAKLSRPLKKRVDRAEARVGELETELETLRSQQADPAHYQDAQAVQRVAQRVAAVESSLAAAYSDWESAGAELEALEAEL